MEYEYLMSIRKDKHLTREYVAGLTDGVMSVKRLEHIEKGTTEPLPEDIVLLSKVYEMPELCLNYCSKHCAIGKATVPMYEMEVNSTKDLPIITLELLDTINSLSMQKDRMISIAADGKIDDDERADFTTFKEGLEKMENAIKSLKVWAQKQLQ